MATTPCGVLAASSRRAAVAVEAPQPFLKVAYAGALSPTAACSWQSVVGNDDAHEVSVLRRRVIAIVPPYGNGSRPLRNASSISGNNTIGGKSLSSSRASCLDPVCEPASHPQLHDTQVAFRQSHLRATVEFALRSWGSAMRKYAIKASSMRSPACGSRSYSAST